ISEPPTIPEAVKIMETVPLRIEIENLGQNDENQVTVECQLTLNEQAIYNEKVTLSSIQTNQSVLVEFPAFEALYWGTLSGTITILNDDDSPADNSLEFEVSVSNVLDDFETDLSLWLNSGSWGLTSAIGAVSGTNSVHVSNGVAPYPNNLDQSLQYAAPLNVSNLDSAGLAYSCWSYTNITDSCFLEISSDNTNWTKIDAVTGIISDWEERRFDLTYRIADVDQLWFRFRFVSDAAHNSFGVLVDDVEFFAVPAKQSSDVTETPDRTLPEKFMLAQNYPNPFNMSTRISYSLPESGRVNLRIYNLQGRLVRQLENRIQTAGIHETAWNGLDENGHEISSGVYVCHLVVNGKPVQNRKMLLLK
ncbi:T9SS type A sorting domain-containing protein, partial [bacterium]|nr:T9SS type A sorting domain-containing protein [bacterium]